MTEPLLRACGWFRPPPMTDMEVAESPPWSWGGPATHKIQTFFFSFFLLADWPLGPPNFSFSLIFLIVLVF